MLAGGESAGARTGVPQTNVIQAARPTSSPCSLSNEVMFAAARNETGCDTPNVCSLPAAARRRSASASAALPILCSITARLFRIVSVMGCEGPSWLSLLANACLSRGTTAALLPVDIKWVAKLFTACSVSGWATPRTASLPSTASHKRGSASNCLPLASNSAAKLLMMLRLEGCVRENAASLRDKASLKKFSALSWLPTACANKPRFVSDCKAQRWFFPRTSAFASASCPTASASSYLRAPVSSMTKLFMHVNVSGWLVPEADSV
mmetsp:Transcript_26764/g.77125  ORF Transcript_26764/g.77125 Transcript_26764/m.77125 type:complete len:265 (-) Transcript_26764:2012-2806(-)